MSEPFDLAMREAIVLREEFANSVTDALDVADTESDLKKLLTVTTKFAKVCSGLQDDIAKKLAGFIGPEAASASVAQPVPISKPHPVHPFITILDAASKSVTPRITAPPVANPIKPSEPDPKITGPAQNTVVKAVVTPNAPVDLHKVRVILDVSTAVIRTIACARVFFPYLNPVTSEESLRAEMTRLNYDVVTVQLFQWNNKKSRGTAVLTLKDPNQAHDLVSRQDILINGWTVAPKILLADHPKIASAEPIAEASPPEKSKRPSDTAETDSSVPVPISEIPSYEDEFDVISSPESQSSPELLLD